MNQKMINGYCCKNYVLILSKNNNAKINNAFLYRTSVTYLLIPIIVGKNSFSTERNICAESKHN